MKKKLSVFFICCAMAIGMVLPAHALLIDLSDSSGHVIYDDVNNNYWIWDLSMFTNTTYNDQVLNISNLDYFGTDNWEMANRDQMEALFSQISMENTYIYELFGKSGVSIDFEGDSNDYWMGRFDEFSSTGIHTFMGGAYVGWNGSMYHGVQLGSIHVDYSSNTTGAWALASVQPVPEPATVFLLSVGLIGMIGTHRKKKYTQI